MEAREENQEIMELCKEKQKDDDRNYTGIMIDVNSIEKQKLKTSDGGVAAKVNLSADEIHESSVAGDCEILPRLTDNDHNQSRMKKADAEGAMEEIPIDGDPANTTSCINAVISQALRLSTSRDHEVPECLLMEDDEKRLKMVAGSHYRAKKRSSDLPQGQDAHFIHYNEKGKATIGVADGVGGWSSRGIDSGVYARELINNAKVDLEGRENGSPNLKKVLRRAWIKTAAEGASTLCIVTLSLRDNFLHAVNIGDSGFMLIREDSKVVYKSAAQQTGFNIPFQLGKASKTPFSPDDAQKIKFKVKNGDVLVAGTDGLFDNLFPEEIVEMVRNARFMNGGGVLPPAGVLARSIVHMAMKMSVDSKSVRPWTKAATDAGIELRRRGDNGGKIDDVTVVVGYIGNSKFMRALSDRSSDQIIQPQSQDQSQCYLNFEDPMSIESRVIDEGLMKDPNIYRRDPSTDFTGPVTRNGSKRVGETLNTLISKFYI